jgi:hypothetical protein
MREWRPGEMEAVFREWDHSARIWLLVIAAYGLLNLAIVAGWIPCTPWIDVPIPIGEGQTWRIDWPPGMLGCDVAAARQRGP